MPRSSTKTKKSASGAGNIRKKTVTKNGKPYTYWEARFTAGYDPGTGKQIQRSITGKTQKEVAQKLREVTAEIDQGTYQQPSKMTLSEWLDIWLKEYVRDVKPKTLESYECQIRCHLKPDLGSIKLCTLSPHQIQVFYNKLSDPDKGNLSPKSIRIIHGILHEALSQAIKIGFLRTNPTEPCTLPKPIKHELKPLDGAEIKAFMDAVKDTEDEILCLVTLFTGLRQGELLGLTWEHVDLAKGTLLICQQLQKIPGGGNQYQIITPKNGRYRVLTPAPYVMELLKQQLAKQEEWRKAAGSAWCESGFVFSDPLGNHLMPHTVYHHFKRIAESIGRPDARFHDLRHSYAVAAIRSGDDIKTVQGNLGHATASFTLDVYGHFTDAMRRESANRMQAFIENVGK